MNAKEKIEQARKARETVTGDEVQNKAEIISVNLHVAKDLAVIDMQIALIMEAVSDIIDTIDHISKVVTTDPSVAPVSPV